MTCSFSRSCDDVGRAEPPTNQAADTQSTRDSPSRTGGFRGRIPPAFFPSFRQECRYEPVGGVYIWCHWRPEEHKNKLETTWVTTKAALEPSHIGKLSSHHRRQYSRTLPILSGGAEEARGKERTKTCHPYHSNIEKRDVASPA